MTRPDKRAARFRYAKPKTVYVRLDARWQHLGYMSDTGIHASAGTHGGGDVLDVGEARFVQACIANPAAPTVAELQAGTPLAGLSWTGGPEARDRAELRGQGPAQQRTRRVNLFVEWADEVLDSYDADRIAGDQPWPYGSF